MTVGWKAAMRGIVPKSLQVPMKFWLDRVRGYMEPEMVLLPHVVKPGFRVVDVGGNRGVYAYQFWRLGAVVEVFEPNPACLSVLAAWARGRQRVVLHAVGLSDHAGAAQLHIPVDAAGVEHDASGSLEGHDFGRAREEVISVSTLDAFAVADVQFIKIDVEGHESRVIAGAQRTLAASRPALLVEIEQRHCANPIGEVFESIRLLGYHGYYFSNGRLVPIDDFDVQRHQALGQFGQKRGMYINNFLFLHGSRIAAGEYSGLGRFGLAQ